MALIVNGEYVGDERFIEVFRQLGGFDLDPTEVGRRHEAATLRQVAERRVLEMVLLREMAIEAGFTVTPNEVSARRARQWGTSSATGCGVAVQRQLADDLLVEKYCHWLGRHEPHASRLEVEQYYMRHRAEFRTPERLRVAHIISNIDLPADEEGARTRIEQAERELETGASFAKVADKFSDCGGRAILGWVERGTMVPEFEEVVFSLAQGGRSSIFRTIFGFHIATVLQKKPAGFESLAEVRPILARRMLEERKRRVVQGAVEQALQTASIEVVSEERATL